MSWISQKTDIKMQANIANNFLVSYCFWNLSTACIFGTNWPISIGSIVKGCFANDAYNQSEKWKLNLTDIDSFCLIASHMFNGEIMVKMNMIFFYRPHQACHCKFVSLSFNGKLDGNLSQISCLQWLVWLTFCSAVDWIAARCAATINNGHILPLFVSNSCKINLQIINYW